eukprot:1160192-Pelagomonas_calceolata.AAC.7
MVIAAKREQAADDVFLALFQCRGKAGTNAEALQPKEEMCRGLTGTHAEAQQMTSLASRKKWVHRYFVLRGQKH